MAEKDTPPPSLRSLLTGKMTPEKRRQISTELRGLLNPMRSASSPDKRTKQIPPFWGATPMRENPNADLALQMTNEQYPEAAERSPTATVLPLYPWMRGRRFEGSGHVQLKRGIVPDDADAPPDWSRKFLGLLDTMRHELSHGMGLPDNYDGWRGLSAQDVSDASARLHEDIELPPQRPPDSRLAAPPLAPKKPR